jgi:uncharacterized protein involved in exopolysaccharide biosynthesis
MNGSFQPGTGSAEENETGLTDILIVLLKHKAVIFTLAVTAALLAGGYAAWQPNRYTATARILPPAQSGSGVSGLLSESSGLLGGLAGSIFGQTSGADLYVGILQSRNVAEQIVSGFHLRELYRLETMEETYAKLAELTHISISGDNKIITVSVDDESPQRAADMANAYLEALDRINRSVNITGGQRKRVFLESRLDKVKGDLFRAETNLLAFQEKHKLVSIDSQAKAAIEGAARLKGEIILARTELEVLKEFGTERQNELIMLKSKIAELENQLARIESGTGGENPDDFFLSFRQLPALGIDLARLMREAKVQEEVFKLVTTQYELAKIEEAKDVVTVQVLDRAIAPDKKSGPKRALITILSVMLGCILGAVLSFFLEFMSRLKGSDPGRYQELREGLAFRQKRAFPAHSGPDPQ